MKKNPSAYLNTWCGIEMGIKSVQVLHKVKDTPNGVLRSIQMRHSKKKRDVFK